MKRFDGFCTPKITTVNFGDNFPKILTFVVFVNKSLVSLSLYPPKQINEAQSCAMRQVEQCKQSTTENSFKSSCWWNFDTNKYTMQPTDYNYDIKQ